ncbi:MAG: tetratricopeptide repeat protein [Phycisphaerales bacterium]|jgi:tetratricopeptide (TPR) repeat protein
MHPPSSRILCVTLAACLGGSAITVADDASRWEAPAPSAQVGTPDLRAVWDDPAFQKSFVAGYGVNPEVEPRISQDDMALLELVRQLMPDELPAAEALLRDSIKDDTSAVLDLTLGGVQYQQERADEALRNYRRSVEKYPNFRRAYRSIGLICVRKGMLDDAIAAFNRMIELGGADAYSYGLLGYCHSQKQDYQPAEAAYRNALLLQPTNVEWRLGLTRSVFKQGKFEDAASLLDVLIQTFPDKSDFWMLQAHTYLGMKQPQKAAVNLEALDAIGKASVDSMFTLGDIYLAESLPDLALHAYVRALSKDPAQGPGRAIRSAEGLASRGGTDQARTLVGRVKETAGSSMGDGDKRKLLKLEARLSMAGGGGDEATARVLEEVIELDPLDGEALMLLGQYHNKGGRPDQAILFFERAAKIDAFAANAKVKMAQVYVAQARFGEALPLLRDAQAIRPREDVARYIEQVERASKSRK